VNLDEAIIHAEDVASAQGCTECGQQHRQLAAWLRELRDRRAHDGILQAENTVEVNVDEDKTCAVAEAARA